MQKRGREGEEERKHKKKVELAWPFVPLEEGVCLCVVARCEQ